jgi:acid stress-induced BolA-like protein IbaG/YrbA
MLDPKNLEAMIAGALPGSTVEVRDTTGTGDHFEARVVSPSFEGKSMVEQHKLVYAPLQELLRTGELHALALKTYTPEQWQKFGGR